MGCLCVVSCEKGTMAMLVGVGHHPPTAAYRSTARTARLLRPECSGCNPLNMLARMLVHKLFGRTQLPASIDGELGRRGGGAETSGLSDGRRPLYAGASTTATAGVQPRIGLTYSACSHATLRPVASDLPGGHLGKRFVIPGAPPRCARLALKRFSKQARPCRRSVAKLVTNLQLCRQPRSPSLCLRLPTLSL